MRFAAATACASRPTLHNVASAFRKFSSMASPLTDPAMQASFLRSQELREALAGVRESVKSASVMGTAPVLVAVSKLKPASDILACYEEGHRDFGENYVQELIDKAAVLPSEVRWHFIGTLQTNKAKILASIPNLYCIQTLASAKAASALNGAIPDDREDPLRVLIQVNTSGEESKSGLPTLCSGFDVATSDVGRLANHILKECPRLRFEGLMTIGSIEQSLKLEETKKNADFETLREARDVLQEYLENEHRGAGWGYESSGNLLLSMGMSNDYEAALKAGSNIVRIGTGIFGQRVRREI